MTGAELLWESAGRPRHTDAKACWGEACWWCGTPCDGVAVPQRDAVAETFPDLQFARRRASKWVCLACAWTMSDHVALPASFAQDGLLKRLEAGGRVTVALRSGDGSTGPLTRFLGLLHPDSTVSLWSCGANAAAEEPWTAVVSDLRAQPRDVNYCKLLHTVPIENLSTGASAKFRNYHHISDGNWEPVLNDTAGKARLRVLLCGEPPRSRWACVIGDGQKHAAIHANASGPGVRQFCFLGQNILYTDALASYFDAYHALLLAGHSDDAIASGHYSKGGLEAAAAARLHDKVLRPIRGSRLFEAVAFLRASRKELTDAQS